MDPTQAIADQLAAIALALLRGGQQQLAASVTELRERQRQATEAGLSDALPRLSTLVADARFEALGRAVDEDSVDLNLLQATIERLLAPASKAATPPSPLERMLPRLVEAATRGQDIEALLAELRADLVAEHPDKTADEVDAFITEFRGRLGAFSG